MDNKVDKWDSIIRSKCFYDAIWNEKIPQTYNEITELNGKEFLVIKYNDEGLKYQVLVEELRKYGYVPEDWYKQYITFCDDIKKLKELNYQKNGVAIDDELI